MKKKCLCLILIILLSISGCYKNNNENELKKAAKLADEFNKHNNTIHIERIKNGDFSNIKDWFYNENISDYYYELLRGFYESQINELEWVIWDINGDGVDELIWREKDLFQRTIAIFAFGNDEVDLVFVTTGNARHFYFIGVPGNFVYYSWYYGTFASNSFDFYKFDDNFNKDFIYRLCILRVDDFTEGGGDEEWWYENYPYIYENGLGTYYSKVYLNGDVESVEYISKEQFFYEFTEMTGFCFESALIGDFSISKGEYYNKY